MALVSSLGYLKLINKDLILEPLSSLPAGYRDGRRDWRVAGSGAWLSTPCENPNVGFLLSWVPTASCSPGSSWCHAHGAHSKAESKEGKRQINSCRSVSRCWVGHPSGWRQSFPVSPCQKIRRENKYATTRGSHNPTIFLRKLKSANVVVQISFVSEGKSRSACGGKR